ncbi:MAG: hypothetical protein L3J03_07505 [Desulfobacterales bacterium]|nr:hypothetical protein [Desulfobacterales bacterium]
MPVSVYQWLRFVHSGLRSILVLFEQARMGEDEVLVNAYKVSNPAELDKTLYGPEIISGFVTLTATDTPFRRCCGQRVQRV